VVTLALAYAIEAVWFRNTEIVSSGGAEVEAPSLFGADLGIGTGQAFPRLEFGLLCLAVLVAVAVGVARLRTSRLGSEMLAVRANERSAAGIGVNVTLVKLMAFGIASFIAGLGGSLLAYRRGTVSFDGFSTIGNLTLLSTAYLAGVTSVLGGVLAGLLAAGGLVFFATDRMVDLGPWFPIISGALVIVTVIAHPEGLASAGHALADRIALRRATAGPGDGDGPATTEPSPPRLHQVDLTTSPAEEVLVVDDLTVRYGGVTAVEDVSLRVGVGAVVGLIGPNGAGKTSVIDAVTGFAPSTGSVRLLGHRVDGERPHRRVHEGLARTFQSLELYDDLTVEENVTAATGSARGAARAQAMTRALDLVGIGHLRERPAGELSQGERQLVSIARACAAEPRLLLLDEPAAGLDTTESRWLGERIRTIAASGVGILLVDHDVGLVLSVCDHVYVLDFGRVIAEGDADAIRADRAVADAYLGQAREQVVAP
jgi:sulfate-transporting ATPase